MNVIFRKPTVRRRRPLSVRVLRKIPNPARFFRRAAAKSIRMFSQAVNFARREYYNGVYRGFHEIPATIIQHSGALQRHGALLDELETAMEISNAAIDRLHDSIQAPFESDTSNGSKPWREDLERLRAELTRERRRIRQLLEEARPENPTEPPLLSSALSIRARPNDGAKQPPDLDALRAALEDSRRESPECVKNRLRNYLPLLMDAGLGTAELPVLDLGCGRGEWLELLRENDLAAQGVEINHVFVDSCQALGLNVCVGDLLGHLHGLSSASEGAITLFQVVEQLPFETLVCVIDEIVRVLKPGGMALFETPNPQALQGISGQFADPTRRNPILHSTFACLAEQRGLQRVTLWYDQAAPDYALIGWKA